MKGMLASFAGLLLAAAVVAAQSQASPQAVATVPDYKVGPQDVIQIEILTPQGTGIEPAQATIGADGMITYAVLGQLKVEGMTCREIERLIKTKLVESKQVSVEPNVAVTMTAYRSQTVNVQGAVKTAGPVQLTGPEMTVFDALSKAGGFAMDHGYELQIKRPKSSHANGGSLPIDPSSTGPDVEVIPINIHDLEAGAISAPKLQNNDLIYVPKAETFTVAGEVHSAGSYSWEPGMTLEKAILQAGGFGDHASKDGVHVRRADPKSGELKFGPDIDQKKQSTYQIHAGDYIEVKKRWSTPLGSESREP
jgi:protein involved in polysaccharide export with SLBB domain